MASLHSHDALSPVGEQLTKKNQKYNRNRDQIVPGMVTGYEGDSREMRGQGDAAAWWGELAGLPGADRGEPGGEFSWG